MTRRSTKEKPLKFDAQMSTIERGLELVMERMGVTKWDYRRFGDGEVIVAWIIKDEAGFAREFQVRSTRGERFKDNLRACEQALTLIYRVYELYQVERSGGRATLADMFMSFMAMPDESVLALPAATFDPWQELGIPRTATVSEIKEAYRLKAKEYHPDRGGSNEMMIRVTKARDTILEMRGQKT